jgi:hypothetical protein
MRECSFLDIQHSTLNIQPETGGLLMAPIKTGDRVAIVTRDVTTEDTKNGLYFSYFGALAGTVDRFYDDGCVCVDIDLESLTDDMRERHQEMQEIERQRWLTNLSDEARNRLNAEQKKLKMSYKILVSKKDIEPDKPAKGRNSKTSDLQETQSPARKPADKPDSSETAKKTAPKRLSEADLSAAEEEFIRSRQRSGGAKQ